MESIPETWLVIFFSVGLIAGFIDAIAGGGGLLTLPVLLAAGLSPVQALGTNKLQGSVGTLSSTLYFVRKRYIDLNAFKWPIILTLIGSSAGAFAVQLINPSFLSRVIPWLLVAIAGYFLFSPNIGAKTFPARLGVAGFGFIFGTGIGFYDGFFGPGTGTFFTIACLMTLGLTLPKATAHAKLLNLCANISALAMFTLGGHIVWKVGLLMAAGQLIGSRLGAKMVITRGNRIIKPLTITICISMSIKLLLEAY